jgi:hypothetical protein
MEGGIHLVQLWDDLAYAFDNIAHFRDDVDMTANEMDKGQFNKTDNSL